MNTKIKAVAAIACGVVACGLSQSAQANLVVDGGFDGATGQLASNGNATSPAWSSGADASHSYGFVFNQATGAATGGPFGTVALYGPPPASTTGGGDYFGIDPVYTPAGGGTAANSGINSVSQTISGLVPGATYTLSFYWAAAQQTGFSGNTTEGWNFSLGNSVLSANTVTGSDVSGHFGGWQLETVTLVAGTSTSELLKFVAEGGPGSGNPPFDLLDGVSLTKTVPDSSSTAGLMGLGVAAMGIAAGCRRFVRA